MVQATVARVVPLSGTLREPHMPILRDLDESVKWVRRTIDSHESAIQEVCPGGRACPRGTVADRLMHPLRRCVRI
jgi:hypothetical protein